MVCISGCTGWAKIHPVMCYNVINTSQKSSEDLRSEDGEILFMLLLNI